MSYSFRLTLLLVFGTVLEKAETDTSGMDSNGCRHIVVTNSPQKSFSNAQSQCNTREGSLAVIKDQATQTFISNRVPPSTTGYWIGGAYSAASAQWVWDDGTIIPLPGQSGYHNWYTAPSDSSNKGCLVMGSPQWFNAACDNAQALPYICQVAGVNPCSSSPCDHRHQCRNVVCQYFCDSCATGYYGDDCRYLHPIFITSNEQLIRENNSLNLEFSCTFAGFPLPNITWIFNGTEINTDDANYDITSTINPELDQTQQNLTIYQIKCIGTTTVTCQAKNNEGNNVTKELSVDPGLTIIQNFSTIIAKCEEGRIDVAWQTDELIPEDLLEKITYKITVQLSNGSLVFEKNISYQRRDVTLTGLQAQINYTITLTANINSCETEEAANVTVNIMLPNRKQLLPPTDAHVIKDDYQDTQRSIFLCSVKWKSGEGTLLEDSDFFKIIASGKSMTYRDTQPPDHRQIFQLNPATKTHQEFFFKSMLLTPNRNYTFEIYLTSCVGDGSITKVSGNCLTQNTGPDYVPAVNITGNPSDEGRYSIFLPKIDEVNGLIKCVLVVVQPIADLSQLDEAQPKFQEINSSLDEDGVYITIAHNYRGVNQMYVLGDGTVTSCQFPLEKQSNRSINATDEQTTVQATNLPLNPLQNYRIYVIAVTPSYDGNTSQFSYSSNAYLVSRTSNNTKQPNSEFTTNTIIITSILGVVLLLSVLLNLYFIMRKRESQKKFPVTATESPEEHNAVIENQTTMDHNPYEDIINEGPQATQPPQAAPQSMEKIPINDYPSQTEESCVDLNYITAPQSIPTQSNNLDPTQPATQTDGDGDGDGDGMEMIPINDISSACAYDSLNYTGTSIKLRDDDPYTLT